MSQYDIVDQLQRRAAIDPTASFIVQAPAGSGKTELLIQRFLALLGQVERPQQILAITFTRKAAAEMRNRLLEALNLASEERPGEEHKALTWELANRVLMQDKEKNWNLLQNPSLLAIQTIDSYNSSLVQKMPWLSRFGSLPELAADADRLYLKATERLLLRLGTNRPGSEQLARLLSHLDNRVKRLQQMLMSMLQKRDQWLRHLFQIQGADARKHLETALAQLVEQHLVELVAAFPGGLSEDILSCGRVAAANLSDKKERPLLYLTDLDWLPQARADHLAVWQGIADLLLTSGGDLRKSRGIDARCGFPAAEQETRSRMQQLVAAVEEYPEFVALLTTCREMPAAKYPEDQWQILECLVDLLPLLGGELWLVFQAEGTSDFAEIALMANAALGEVEDPSDLLLKLDSALEHILVDEFQDTSWMQYGLLEKLTCGWQPGDGRTLFLVGDPMQSIYRFREAEVGLFLKSFSGQLGSEGPLLEPIRLRCNFRSQQGIVDWVNATFSVLFPTQIDIARGAVPLASANAVLEPLAGSAVQLTAFSGRDDSAEARRVADLVEQAQREDPDQSLAILVRSRTHLPQILSQLRERKIAYQAQDIELLGTQPAALDLIALTRALLHHADQLSWLTVLRAPWCGLVLTDLQLLCDVASGTTLPGILSQEKNLQLLSQDGRHRLERVWPCLSRALEQRGGFPLRELVESCWLSLGGPACYDKTGVEDAGLVLDLLESLEQGADLQTLEDLSEGVAKLFAQPDSSADGRLQVMTIHKAKGLEFDQVILPGLGRMPARNDSPLLRWMEHPQVGLLLAPIAARDGSEQDPVYRTLGRLENDKQELEAVRLLYVAATRAKKRLHLLGHADLNKQDELQPAVGSLLEKLWPVIKQDFIASAEPAQAKEERRRKLMLKRLAVDWQVPSLSPLNLPVFDLADSASIPGSKVEKNFLFSGWEQQTRRHIGTIVHQVLEKIALQGPAIWAEYSDEVLSAYLITLGVPQQEVERALGRIRLAIEQTMKSARGRWILERHVDSGCEVEISGSIDGQLVNAVIDRTFVDASGVRWVIDYKTSTPGDQESEVTFLNREVDHYRPQLSTYVRLFSNLEQQSEIRSALYFPIADIFVEVDDATYTRHN